MGDFLTCEVNFGPAAKVKVVIVHGGVRLVVYLSTMLVQAQGPCCEVIREQVAKLE
jgi:hypothetical protein